MRVGLVLAEARQSGRVGGASVAHGGRSVRVVVSSSEAVYLWYVVCCRVVGQIMYGSSSEGLGRRESAVGVCSVAD